MPGFDFRYRLGGGSPTIRSFVRTGTKPLARGDMLNAVEGMVDLGGLGDVALVGAAIESLEGDGPDASIRVITDGDAVYGVDDAHARTRGDSLDLVGPTGDQGVSTATGSEFTVVLDCTAEEETLVRIDVDVHSRAAAPATRQRPLGADLNAAITRAVVRHHRVETGRGPSRARAFYRDDVIVVLLEDLMSKAERRLVARGKDDAVTQLRQALQDSLREDMVAVIERLTGIRVRAFMSGNHLDPDVAVEVFVLEAPVRGDGLG